MVASEFKGQFRGRRVLLTGHTGFKGSWMAEWLIRLGAQVTGLALPPEGAQAHFSQLGLEGRLNHRLGDIRDPEVVRQAVEAANPEFVFHLAAQPLVRLSYKQPVETVATNVLGTAHVLDAVRNAGSRCCVVAVTTDKCYENKEWIHSYREEDPMGGYDLYSASKGAAELIVSAYRRSFFSSEDSQVRLSSARAGNVIGGGDWAEDRIVPDCIRSLTRGEKIPVRNRTSTRPWQHVLEPLSGYLQLAAAMDSAGSVKSPIFGGFNFGPRLESNKTVRDLVEEILKHWPGEWDDKSDPNAVHEAGLLNLATDKAYHLLDWKPAWDFSKTVAATTEWYRKFNHGENAEKLTTQDLENYVADARRAAVSWAS